MCDPMLHSERSLAAILTNRPAHCADAIVLRSSSFQQASWEKSAVVQLVPFFFLEQYFTVIKTQWFCQAGGRRGSRGRVYRDAMKKEGRRITVKGGVE